MVGILAMTGLAVTDGNKERRDREWELMNA